MKFSLPLEKFSLTENLNLWKILGLLLIFQNLLLTFLTQSASQFLDFSLGWSGAFLVCRSDLPASRQSLRPTVFGACFGGITLAWVQWRSYLMSGADPGITLFPFVTTLGLLLLAFPLNELKRFWPSFLILSLLPMVRFLFIQDAFTQYLVRINTLIIEIFLLLCGLPSQGEGGVLILNRGGIEIAARCAGLETVLQMLMVAIIFALAFPMRYFWQNVVMFIVAPVLGVIVNAVRIGFLLFVNSSDIPNAEFWFSTFHTGWPALLFPAVAMFLFVQVYLVWMERQVAEIEGL